MASVLKVKKEDYEDLGVCIRTEQVPANEIAEYFKDKAFLKWYTNRYFEGVEGDDSESR